MKQSTKEILGELVGRYPALNLIKKEILKSFEILIEAIENDKKILICGNGGSASDSEHIVGELLKSFKKPRKIKKNVYDGLIDYGKQGERLRKSLEGAIRAIALTTNSVFSTAFSNDKDYTATFAQQVYGLGVTGDVLICISTSGNSENCVLAAVTANVCGMKTISMTGQRESNLSAVSDVTIKVPEIETYRVQELHLPVYHCLCAMLEEELF